MNIAGITQTAQTLPQTQQITETEAPSTQFSELMGSDSVNLSAQVSVQVMDMAQRQFEQAANELISTMAAATGVGSGIDVSA